MLKKFSFVFVAGVLAAAQYAYADSIVVSVRSWHASDHGAGETKTNHNEENPGIGYEHILNKNNTLAFGYFVNSFDRHANYLVDYWQPLQWETRVVGRIKFGCIAGISSGYRNSIVPVVVPMLTYENRFFGFNFVTLAFPIPKFFKRSVFAVQVKINIP
jgi:hypothetical protein